MCWESLQAIILCYAACILRFTRECWESVAIISSTTILLAHPIRVLFAQEVKVSRRSIAWSSLLLAEAESVLE